MTVSGELAAGDTEMSVILPALQCLVGKQRIWVYKEKVGERKAPQVGGRACAKAWRQETVLEWGKCNLSIGGGAGVCQGMRPLSLACDGERDG